MKKSPKVTLGEAGAILQTASNKLTFSPESLNRLKHSDGISVKFLQNSHPSSCKSLTLKLPGGGPNGPTFKNIGYGSHMKKKMCYLECM